MTTIVFQLGHCPEVSHAELTAVNQRLGEPLSGLRHAGSTSLAECPVTDDAHELLSELGGVIRGGAVLVPEVSTDPETIARRLEDSPLFPHLQQKEKKIILGLSLLGDASPFGGKRKTLGWLHSTADAIKKKLESHQCNVRFVMPQEGKDGLALNGAQVDRNNIGRRGAELLFRFVKDDRVELSQTFWWQPFDAFSSRDYGRPNRDSRSGMLPPKLARMMVNLARTETTQTLLDPFCGSGSVLMEAALMGLDATGIDVSEKAIRDTHANQEWLQSRTSPPGSMRAVTGDVQELRTLCEPLYFDACATEPDLGPPLRGPMPVQRYDEVAKRLTALYRRALGEIRTVVRPGARVVFLVPRIRIEGRDTPGQLYLTSDLQLQGYTLLDPMKDFEPSGRRTTLVYSRPRQFVQREIFVLQA